MRRKRNLEHLANCPFCGNHELELEDSTGDITCNACAYTFYDTSVDSAWWNSRPIEDQLRAENERLKEVMIEFIDAAFVMEHINAIGNPKKKTFQWWNYADKMRVVLGIKRKNITEQDLQNFKDGYLKAQQALKEVKE